MSKILLRGRILKLQSTACGRRIRSEEKGELYPITPMVAPGPSLLGTGESTALRRVMRACYTAGASGGKAWIRRQRHKGHNFQHAGFGKRQARNRLAHLSLAGRPHKMAAPGVSPRFHIWRSSPAAYSSRTRAVSAVSSSGVKASAGKRSVLRRETEINCMNQFYQLRGIRPGRQPFQWSASGSPSASCRATPQSCRRPR